MKYACALLFILFASATAGGQDAQGLIDRYERERARRDFALIEGQELSRFVDSKSGKPFFARVDVRYATDGNRVDLKTSNWDDESGFDRPLLESSAEVNHFIWDASASYDYQEDPRHKYYRASIGTDKDRARIEMARNPAAPLAGYFPGDDRPVTAVLKQATQLTVGDGTFNGSPCQVIRARTAQNGSYEIWLDPARSYQLVKAVVTKGPDDLYYGQKVSAPQPDWEAMGGSLNLRGRPVPPSDPKREVTFEYEVTGFTRSGDASTPNGAKWVTREVHAGRTLETSVEHREPKVVLSPDLAASGAFVPRMREGTRVTREGENSVIPLRWTGGQARPAVDEELVGLLDQRISEMKTTSTGAARPPEATARTEVAVPGPAAGVAPAAGELTSTKVAWGAAVLGAVAVLGVFWWVMTRRVRRAP